MKVLLCFGRNYDRILAVVNKAGELKISFRDAVLKNSKKKKKIKEGFVPMKQTFRIPFPLSVLPSTCASVVVR